MTHALAERARVLVIFFISVFEYITFVSNQFLSIYHIYFLGHIFIYTSFGLNKFLAPLPETLVSL